MCIANDDVLRDEVGIYYELFSGISLPHAYTHEDCMLGAGGGVINVNIHGD